MNKKILFLCIAMLILLLGCSSQKKIEKGNVIEIGGQDYLVLNIEDNDAYLMCKRKLVQIYFNEEEKTPALYNGSDLQEYLEEIYSEDLIGFKDAIIPQDITVGTYNWFLGEPEEDYTFKGTYGQFKNEINEENQYYVVKTNEETIKEQHIYPLDIQDIADYLGKDEISSKNISEMFETVIGNYENFNYFWLRSNYSEDANKIFNIIGGDAVIDVGTPIFDDSVYMTMHVDLEKVNFRKKQV